MKNKKRIGFGMAVFATALFLQVSVATVPAGADVVYRGTCGPKSTWTLDDKGTLKISGKGTVKTRFDRQKALKGHCDEIENVIIGNKITEVKSNIFRNCVNLKSVTVGKGVKKISAKFVKNTPALKTIRNRSKVKVSLYNENGSRTWKVGKKKTTKLAAGKTATSTGKKYQVVWDMMNIQGVKVDGIMQKNYHYGEKIQLPQAATLDGYEFLGWGIQGASVVYDGIYAHKASESNYHGAVKIYPIFRKYSATVVENNRIKVAYEAPEGDTRFQGYGAFISENQENVNQSIEEIYRADTKFVQELYSIDHEDTSKALKPGKTYYVTLFDVRYDQEDGEPQPCGATQPGKTCIVQIP